MEDVFPNRMINFQKHHKTAEVIQDIKRWQVIPYSFTSVDIILAFLEDALNRYDNDVDYNKQFLNLSLIREPIDGEDEAMVISRLL